MTDAQTFCDFSQDASYNKYARKQTTSFAPSRAGNGNFISDLLWHRTRFAGQRLRCHEAGGSRGEAEGVSGGVAGAGRGAAAGAEVGRAEAGHAALAPPAESLNQWIVLVTYNTNQIGN